MAKQKSELVNSKGKSVLKAQTVMSRGLLIAEYYINIKIKKRRQEKDDGEPKLIEKMFPIYVATSHFESLDGKGFK